MTDTEAKALALVNADYMMWTADNITTLVAGFKAMRAREAATEARHAAELREQAGRFREVAVRAKGFLKDITQVMMMTRAVVDEYDGLMADLTPFILPAPDPLVEAIKDLSWDDTTAAEEWAKDLRAALAARGYEVRKIGEVGE